jgi:HK97 family phage major capsid protein
MATKEKTETNPKNAMGWNFSNLVSDNAHPRNVKEIREERVGKIDAAQKILDQAQLTKRDLTAAEKGQVELITASLSDLDCELREAERIEREQAEKAGAMASAMRAASNGQQQRHLPRSGWMDRNGEPVAVLGRGELWSDLYKDRNASAFSLGNLVRAFATGDSRFAKHEIAASMSGGSNNLGGFLVPDLVSSRVLDLARAQSAVTQAGAVVVPMESETLTLAKVMSDPTFATHAENATLSETDIAFGAITFTTRTIGCYVRISRELAADAPNVGQVVENCLAKALAAELDRQAIDGDAGTEFQGLKVNADISQTASVGGVSWEELHGGVVAVQNNNYTPSAYICSPTIAGDWDLLTSGDGTNASKNWLGPPPGVAGLNRFTTTNCPNGYAFVGDFSQVAFGIRQGALLEATTTGGDAFTKHSLLIKCTWRGCFRVLQPGAIHRLAGITT